MADLFNPADPFLDLRRVDTDPLPPPSVNGIPSADSDDEGPHGSEECGTLAAPKFPAVGRQDDKHESQKYSAPVRSRMNWLSSAALMTARTAARVVASALTDPRYPPGPRQSYPGNYYNPATSASHASCPLCGTPYQGSSSRWGPSYAPMIGYEQAQSGHHPCPACHCPTSIRPSSTGAPTRFLSSGRGEYITGHPSPSQHLGVTTNYARPQAAFSGNVAGSMSTPDPGYQASPTDSSISGRSFGVTHTETRNDVPEYPPLANRARASRHDANITSASMSAGVNSRPVSASGQRGARTRPSVTSAGLLSSGVTRSGFQPHRTR